MGVLFKDFKITHDMQEIVRRRKQKAFEVAGEVMEFNYDGLHFDAWEGGLIVTKNGEKVLQAFDVFRKGIPPKEKIIEFYNALLEMSGETE